MQRLTQLTLMLLASCWCSSQRAAADALVFTHNAGGLGETDTYFFFSVELNLLETVSPGGGRITDLERFQDFDDFAANVVGTWQTRVGSETISFEVAPFGPEAFSTPVLVSPVQGEIFRSGDLIALEYEVDPNALVGPARAGDFNGETVASHFPPGWVVTLDDGVREDSLLVAGAGNRRYDIISASPEHSEHIDNSIRFTSIGPYVNVRVVSVPEPSSYLVCSAIGSVAIVQRRSRRSMR